MTGALRQALFWFTSLLAGEVSRWIDFSSLRKKLHYDLVVYSDATGDGRCAAVACWPDGSVTFCRQHFPNNRRKRLAIRSTQVVAYELWAAAMAILTFVLPYHRHATVFVDNQAALQCLVKAYSKVPDLNNISGGVMHLLSLSSVGIYFEYVESAYNLADGPSRDDLRLLRRVHAREVPARVPDWSIDSLTWLPDVRRT